MIIKFIKKILNIKKLDLKINKTTFLPFNKIKVRLKKEIVTLGKKNLKLKFSNNNYVSPAQWNQVITDDNTTVIDVRNNFEISIAPIFLVLKLSHNSAVIVIPQ